MNRKTPKNDTAAGSREQREIPLDDRMEPRPTASEDVPAVAPEVQENGKLRRKSGPIVKRLAGGIVLGAALVVGGIYGRGYWQWAAVHETTDDAFIDGAISQVSPQISGHVLKVLVQDNGFVRAGDVLLELDPRDAQAALDGSKGRLAAGQANLLSAKKQVEQGKAQVVAAKAAVEQAKAEQASKQADADKAQEDMDAYTQARGSGVVSSIEWTKAQTSVRTTHAALEVSKTAVAAAEAQVLEAQAALESRESSVQVADALVQTAQAGVDTAALNRSYVQVFAAEDGRVTRKNVEPGNFVTPGTPLMALVAPRVWVTANFKETQLVGMKPGQPVDIAVDAYPGAEFQGHVDSIQQGSGARFSLLPPENATGNYVKVVQRVPVKIVFDTPPDEQHVLGPGMSVVPSVFVGDGNTSANGRK